MNEKDMSDKQFISQINSEYAPSPNPPIEAEPAPKPITHSKPESSLTLHTEAWQMSDELNNGYESEGQTGILKQPRTISLETTTRAEHIEAETPLPLKNLSFAEKRQRDLERGLQGPTATLNSQAQREKYKFSHWKRKAATVVGVIALGGGVLIAHSEGSSNEDPSVGSNSANVPAQTVTVIAGTTTANAATETATTTNTTNLPSSKELLEASKKDTAAENNIDLLTKSRVANIYKQLGRTSVSTSKITPVISGGAAPVTTNTIPASTEKTPASQSSHNAEKNIRSSGTSAKAPKVSPPKQTGGASLATTTSQNNNGGTSLSK